MNNRIVSCDNLATTMKTLKMNILYNLLPISFSKKKKKQNTEHVSFLESCYIYMNYAPFNKYKIKKMSSAVTKEVQNEENMIIEHQLNIAAKRCQPCKPRL